MTRVGIDYLPAICHAPGVGRYVREFTRALVQLPHDFDLSLVEVGGGKRVMGAAALGLQGTDVRRVRSQLPRRAANILARWTGWTADRWAGGAQLFHSVHPTYPQIDGAVRQVLAVSELPAAGSSGERVLRERYASIDAFCVFSDHYARDLTQRFGIAPERIHRVPVGCDHWLRDLPRELEPAPHDQLLVLGAIRAARYPVQVLHAFERLRAGGCDAQLLFVGRPGDAADEFRAALAGSSARPHVRWIDDPVEADMPRLVAQSALLVHVATDEGTAVTPLEACALGPAIAASRVPAFEEALGATAAWIPHAGDQADVAPSAVDIADACAIALDRSRDPEARAERQALAAKFTWRANAEATLAVWRATLE